MPIIFWFSLVLYSLLLLYYFLMVMLFSLLMIRQGLNLAAINLLRMLRPKRSREVKLKKKIKLGQRIRLLFDSSLLLNDLLAIFSIMAPFAVMAELNIPAPIRLVVAPIIVSIIPYLWGYTRSANVGVNSGTIGTALGIAWLILRDPSLNWWMDIPFFLFLNLLANQSGWFGGFTGIGKAYDSVAVSVFEFQVLREGVSLADLLETSKNAIQQELTAILSRKLDPSDTTTDAIAARNFQVDSTDLFAITSKHETQWQIRTLPPLIALQWLFERKLNVHSVNEILDHVFNTWRHTTIKLSISINEHDSLIKGQTIKLVVMTYKETPSIIWADDEVELISLRSFAHLISVLTLASKPESSEWLATPIGTTVIHYWRSRITLEQFSKDTLATRNPIAAMTFSDVSQANAVFSLASQKLMPTEAFFNRFRGRTYAFALFLLSQVALGVLINLVSNQIAPQR